MQEPSFTVRQIVMTRYPSAEGTFHLSFVRPVDDPEQIDIHICRTPGMIRLNNKEEAAELVDLLLRFMEGEFQGLSEIGWRVI